MNSSVERLKQLIEEFGFVSTGVAISDRIVIHGVAGCGKSTLTKELLKDNSFNVVNPLSKEEFDITGHCIKKDLVTFESKINVLDEYLSVNCYQGFQVLLADPFQYKKIPLQANYIKRKSHRLSKELVPILQGIGVQIEAEKEGLTIVKGSAYEFEPKGIIVSTESEVIEYVQKHGIEIHQPHCVQGQEFDIVTVYHNQELKSLERSELYVALTRVKNELRLLQL